MRILFVVPRFHTNQVGIVQALKANGHQVILHCTHISGIENHTIIKPIIPTESIFSYFIRHFFGDGGPNKQRFFPSPLIYWHLFVSASPDLVVIRVHGTTFNYMAAFFSFLYGSKTLFYDQTDIEDLITRFTHGPLSSFRKAKFYLPLFLFNASWFTPICRHSLLDRLPRRCYYLPFVAQPLSRTYHSRSNTLRFLMIAKYQLRKNHHLLLRACALLHPHSNFHLTILGSPDSPDAHILREEVLTAIDDLALQQSVSLISFIEHAEIDSIYQSHDVLVHPASDEPASISVVEALAHGLPVICSDTCGTKTYIEDSSAGFIFKSDSITSLALRMSELLNDRHLVETMSSNALTYSSRYTSLDYFSSRFALLFSDSLRIKL